MLAGGLSNVSLLLRSHEELILQTHNAVKDSCRYKSGAPTKARQALAVCGSVSPSPGSFARLLFTAFEETYRTRREA